MGIRSSLQKEKDYSWMEKALRKYLTFMKLKKYMGKSVRFFYIEFFIFQNANDTFYGLLYYA